MVRDRLELNVLHDRNPQFVVLSDGSIRNGYTVKLLNKIAQPRTVTVALDGLPGGEMSVIGMDYDASRSFAVALEPDRLRTLKIYVRQPRDLVDGRVQSFRFLVDDAESGENTAYTAKFDAPE
jgi:polyferredoxin